MSKYLVFSCFLLAIFILVTPVQGNALAPVNVNDLESNQVSTDDFLGEGYILFEIWATWCPACVISLRDFQDNLEVLQEKRIEIVAISLDDRANTVKSFQENNNIEFIVLHDPNSSSALQWNIRAIPSVFLVAPDGEVLLKKEGYTGFENLWKEIKEVIENNPLPEEEVSADNGN